MATNLTPQRPVVSPMWQLINERFPPTDDLTGFKSGAANFKLALWNPETNGVRYLKALIYNLCSTLTDDNWWHLARIENRQVGDPFTVTYKGEDVCLDYLQAVLELEFITNSLELEGGSILEIGAGYGRTCHAILSHHDIEVYYILDLEPCLKLSRNYLRTVLDEAQFSKIQFVSIENVHIIEAKQFGLCLNIDSFAEMETETVRYYLDYIARNCTYFYVKNPVGKYFDPSLSTTQDKHEVELALSTGLMQTVIDIHNYSAIVWQVPRFVDSYRPGHDWHCLAHAWARPWSYYWQAIYRRPKSGGDSP